MENYKWELGTYFAKSDFKEAISTYAIPYGRNLSSWKMKNKGLWLEVKKYVSGIPIMQNYQTMIHGIGESNGHSQL